MIFRHHLEEQEQQYLAPYAIKSVLSRGRQFDESTCQFRTSFMRDKDRIIHSEAFRRLEYKTQVFINHEGDYYRTRLTHTLEVAQLSRSIARTLQLNEDLCEAIALAHDLGHTPFGHRGEYTLDELMAEHGGFEHNRQSYRTVTMLEKTYPSFCGLNLSIEVLEGIVKHHSEYDKPDIQDAHAPITKTTSLEAQVVNIADEIAYMNHDLDDGLESGMLILEQLNDIPLWQQAIDSVYADFPNIADKKVKYETIRRIIHTLVTDLQTETTKRIHAHNITCATDLASLPNSIIAFSDNMSALAKSLKQFLFINLYRHFKVERMAEKTNRILRSLFSTYLNNQAILPPSVQYAIQHDDSPHRKICDYIAGMTDRYALSEYKKLFDPTEHV